MFIIFKILGPKNSSNLGSILGMLFGPMFRPRKLIEQNIKTALADVELLKIIMDSVGDTDGKYSVECPITTKDGITYEAEIKI